jgi:hypothetical protein
VSCTSHARLDFVGDKEDVVFVADLTEAVEKGWRRGDVASFTQDWL